MKAFARNTLAVICGMAGFIIVVALTEKWFSFIVSIPIIGWILSWPAGPQLYAFSGVVYVTSISTLAIVESLSIRTKNGTNIPMFIIAIYIALMAIGATIGQCLDGIKFSDFGYLLFLGTTLIMFSEGMIKENQTQKSAPTGTLDITL